MIYGYTFGGYNGHTFLDIENGGLWKWSMSSLNGHAERGSVVKKFRAMSQWLGQSLARYQLLIFFAMNAKMYIRPLVNKQN